MVVTRFAPSPTGYLHIGGARTALFSWLLARKTSGSFILRIEDTDRRRSTDESTRQILEDLRWLGLDWDQGPHVGGPHGPYFQSQRLDVYRRYVDGLIEQDKAYPCAGTSDGSPRAVRFKMGRDDVTIHDAILGDVTVKADQLEDFVIQKSDGYPTFHLAVVVDDYLMGITHVLRGQEHLINTAKHIALQKALSFTTPVYAHMPLIFNMDGSKMSKRDKEQALKRGLPAPEIDVHDFRLAGYLPEALLNFIALLGWSPGGDREFMTVDEMIQLFSIERIGKTNARFDRDKLRAFNGEYIRSAARNRLRTVTRQFLEGTDYPLRNADDHMLGRIFDLYQERSRTLVEMAEKCNIFFLDEISEYDPKAVKKVLAKDPGPTVLGDLKKRLADLDPWNVETLQACFEDYCRENDLKLGKVAQPIRVAVTGGTVSPPIYETLDLLGKDRTVGRIQKAIDFLAS